MFEILLVEDDKNIREVIYDFFDDKSKGKMRIDMAEDGMTALEKAYEKIYDLLILDIMLPELDGFSVCREVRKQSDVPIIFITARAAQEDVLNGYALGCDDYIVKPFSLPVFYQKAEALIRRSKGLVRSQTLSAGSLTLNPNNGILKSNNIELNITATEYKILKILLENKGTVVSREKLFLSIWGYDSDKNERVLDSHIKNLRKALGNNSYLIKTVIRRGYKIEE
ncbi:MAG TPA: DNA-binding response regulator [Ruminococcus sp.]|nr:DNA-binding response regulator [Ruminococcus sp.]